MIEDNDVFGCQGYVRIFDSKIPPGYCSGIFSALAGIGFRNLVLYGGALRDALLRIPVRDYDFRLRHGDIEHYYEEKGRRLDFEVRMRRLREHGQSRLLIEDCFENFPHFTNLQHMGSFTSSDSEHYIRYHMQYRGRKIDIIFQEREVTLEGIFSRHAADAPINAIMMDKEGVVLAHPLFRLHLEQRIYSPFCPGRETENHQRFSGLSDHIKGLRFVLPSDPGAFEP